MRLLSVDTTTACGSVALLEDTEVAGEVRLREEFHSRTLFGAIQYLLGTLGVRPAGVDAYVVAVGPGSFTGVRVGLSTVQGLGLASGKPCLGLSSLLGLAAQMRGTAEVLVPIMDAYRDQVFAAVYDSDLTVQREPAAVDLGALLAELPARSVAFLGDGATRYRERLLQARPDAVFPERSFFLAGALGRLAAPCLAKGEGVAAGALRPLYLRTPDIRPSRPLLAR
jgi:tRNA threonylcarbamoyl adenosine modification protein YeaZ